MSKEIKYCICPKCNEKKSLKSDIDFAHCEKCKQDFDVYCVYTFDTDEPKSFVETRAI